MSIAVYEALAHADRRLSRELRAKSDVRSKNVRKWPRRVRPLRDRVSGFVRSTLRSVRMILLIHKNGMREAGTGHRTPQETLEG